MFPLPPPLLLFSKDGHILQLTFRKLTIGRGEGGGREERKSSRGDVFVSIRRCKRDSELLAVVSLVRTGSEGRRLSGK